ncbi:molybdopterin molybdenumtransferase MoeA [Auraticoccus sp. F435]|uniref:Molybdopterin molybdenumtransferase n=1 Tax=Auraticoccus cholistanensis TaxID=2656650 RepID=A0A6A9UV88_9ACTN|nr:gephyrin-like molybdotransferase Glp [Auraticoccus cholistanensis]MVA76611.1 molybdopterin molybdenumtransferase MoeA [Auraticoccus cholistanensis]
MALFGRRKKKDEAPVEEPPAPTLPPAPPVDAAGLRSMEDHRAYLLEQVEQLPAFGQLLLDALDLSICEDIESDVDLPGFDNAAMDGYAVHAEDTAGAAEDSPTTLAVVGEIAAGDWSEEPLPPGTAVKIMTGAPVPPGADAVVPYEQTDRGSEDVVITAAVRPGQHIRRRGEDVSEGDLMMRTGERIGPRHIGLLAAIGVDKVMVRPRPRVVVLATGSELAEPGLPLRNPAQLYDSNSYLLAAAARAEGAQVFRVGSVGDDAEAIRQTISDQLVRADLIITTGGVSQGDYDLVKSVMPELGLTDFCQVAMQPGKPQGFGLIGEDRVPMIMLPGNPVSAYVSFEAFVRPVIRKLMGLEPLFRPPVRAIATHLIRSTPGRKQFARGLVTTDPGGRRSVTAVGGHGSHLVSNMARSNALIVLDPDVDVVPAGSPVEVWLLDEPS